MAILGHEAELHLLLLYNREAHGQIRVIAILDAITSQAGDCRFVLAVHEVRDNGGVASLEAIPVFLGNHGLGTVHILAHFDVRLCLDTI